MKYLVLLFALLLFACSPVRRVLDSHRYSREVGDSLILRGICKGDTQTLTRIWTDTLLVVDTTRVFIGLSSELDSLIGDTRVQVLRDTLYLTRYDSVKTIRKNIEKKVIVRDLAREQVLERELVETKNKLEQSKWIWILIGYAGGLLTIIVGLLIFRR